MQSSNNPQPIDLAEVERLVRRLEEDLQRVSQGSEDLQPLREEVEALRRLLHSGQPPEHSVRQRLDTVSSRLRPVIDEIETDVPYLTAIARILGLT